MSGKKNYLCSRIVLSANLRTSMASARSRMSTNPLLIQSSAGAHQRYLIKEEGRDDRFNILELRKDAIIFSTYSESSPSYFMRDSLLKTISLALYLSEDYDANYACIMPYILYLISGINSSLPVQSMSSFDRTADIMLSGRIVRLKAQIRDLESKVSELNRSLISAASSAIESGYSGPFSTEETCSKLGISQFVLGQVIGNLKERGYRASISKDGRVELMRE